MRPVCGQRFEHEQDQRALQDGVLRLATGQPCEYTDEARADGMSHDLPVARAEAALPEYAADFVRTPEAAAETLPEHVAN